MATWTKTFTREPPKTKAQLREMLTEAVRNTAQPETKRPPNKAKRDRGKKAAGPLPECKNLGWTGLLPEGPPTQPEFRHKRLRRAVRAGAVSVCYFGGGQSLRTPANLTAPISG
jgi:hypothetical protein